MEIWEIICLLQENSISGGDINGRRLRQNQKIFCPYLILSEIEISDIITSNLGIMGFVYTRFIK